MLNQLIPSALLALAPVWLSGCASPQINARSIRKSEPQAVALVQQAQQAHGGGAFHRIRDLSVRYEGHWASIGPRFQPVLSDTGFRRGSEERLLLSQRIIGQEHSGPAGKKVVLRTSRRVTVERNGVRWDDAEAARAAALVADAYTLFLTGPFYFSPTSTRLTLAGEAKVDGAPCDAVLAVLRPGFGEAEEDRVILYIDRANKRLLRVRLSLNGLESTRGAEVDVTFRKFRTIGGVLWPTDFDERIRVPFDLHAHHWRMLGLEINRGFRSSDLTPRGFCGRAAAATRPFFPALP